MPRRAVLKRPSAAVSFRQRPACRQKQGDLSDEAGGCEMIDARSQASLLSDPASPARSASQATISSSVLADDSAQHEDEADERDDSSQTQTCELQAMGAPITIDSGSDGSEFKMACSLARLADACRELLSETEKKTLEANLLRVGELRTFTMCSGSESFSIVMMMLWKARLTRRVKGHDSCGMLLLSAADMLNPCSTKTHTHLQTLDRAFGALPDTLFQVIETSAFSSFFDIAKLDCNLDVT